MASTTLPSVARRALPSAAAASSRRLGGSALLPPSAALLPAPRQRCRRPLPFAASAQAPLRSFGSESGATRHDIGVGPGAAGLTVAEWSAKKNDNKGPAVSERFAGAWCPDDQLRISAKQLDVVPPFMPAVLVRGLLTEEECRGLIEAVPKDGPGYLGKEEVYQLYNDRVVNYRFITHDEGLAERLCARIKEHIPMELDGGRFLRLNPGFRFVHHDHGGHQAGHIDGREPVEAAFDEAAGGWVQSRLSLQIYLNGGYEGGEFVILEPDPERPEGYRPKLAHSAQAGDALLFYQERLIPVSESVYELFHEARDVIKGDKFACRTMVDYVFPDERTAKMSNLKDDRAAE